MANTAVVTWAGRSIFTARMRSLGTEPIYIGWGDSTDTLSQNSDVNLFKPQTELRATGTPGVVTTSFLADTWQLTGLLTCLTTAKTITEAGLFDTPTLSSSVTLVTGMAPSTTTVTISAASGFTGIYFRQVDNECVLVTAGGNSTVETLVRSQLGSTTASTHAVAAWYTVGGDGGAHTNFSLGPQTATIDATKGGNMFAHADYSAIALAISDAINYTWKDELT